MRHPSAVFRFRSVIAGVGALGVMLGVGVQAGTAAPGALGVAPNRVNELDCNGWSKAYQPVSPKMRGLCADPIYVEHGWGYRFVDNGHYVGHDEPSVKFISTVPGSGNHMTYFMQLSTDPTLAPTLSGSVTDYAELSAAPWFGLPICDSDSYPQNRCRPDSDHNSGLISNPKASGSAFLELQFYPPGFPPFQDAVSCSQTQWCVALTIDSLECTFGFKTCNTSCIEPVNFAYLQTDGVPAGPPSPQLVDVQSFLGNARTLTMNPGDVLSASLEDTAAGLKTTVVDRTTGRTGFMVASAANGFMNTDISNCSGRPFSFHPEYSTASQQNQVPWAALEGGVLMEDETGHFEACASLSHQFPVTTVSGGQTFHDGRVFQTCGGGSEASGRGEGPCNPATAVCANAETQGSAGPAPCPSNSAASGALCEFSDAYCMPQGTRSVDFNGMQERIRWPISGCQDNVFQNGDLDFDGIPYHATWPDGTAGHPTPFRYIGPFDPNGNPYPTVQFETDVGGSEFLCNTATGAGCTAPPLGAKFYPFWSTNDSQSLSGVASPSGACVWNFGNDIAGVTTKDFGKDAQYGAPDVARYGGTLTSAPAPNPQFSGRCPSFTQPA